jgi:hypothetical protein
MFAYELSNIPKHILEFDTTVVKGIMKFHSFYFSQQDTKFENEVNWYSKTATRYERDISKQHSNSKKQCWILFLSKMFE